MSVKNCLPSSDSKDNAILEETKCPILPHPDTSFVIQTMIQRLHQACILMCMNESLGNWPSSKNFTTGGLKMIKNESILCESWTIQCSVGSMADTAAIESSERETGVRPLPDMFFPNTKLGLLCGHTEVILDPLGAISSCLLNVDSRRRDSIAQGCAPLFLNPEVRGTCLGGSQVQQAKVWKASSNHVPVEILEYAHDWTFTTLYWGTIFVNGVSSWACVSGTACDDDFLPMSLLTDCTIPLIAFKELDFWEDELDDNGFSRMSVKLRVMKSFWYILMKFELRVDGVINSRNVETRIFHEFKSEKILREFRWIENGTERKCFRVCQTVPLSSTV